MSAHDYPTKAANRRRERFIPNPKLKLKEQLVEVCQFRHFSKRTADTYWYWSRRFLLFHCSPEGVWRHPRELGEAEVRAFLSDVTTTQIYTHVMAKPGLGVRSPLDG